MERPREGERERSGWEEEWREGGRERERRRKVGQEGRGREE